jgi:hypothetical protein
MSREKSTRQRLDSVSLDRRRFTVAAAATAAAVPVSAGLTRAQDATPPAATPAESGVQMEVLASGLLDPRFVAVGADDTIYFTEAGNGGDNEVFETLARERPLLPRRSAGPEPPGGSPRSGPMAPSPSSWTTS